MLCILGFVRTGIGSPIGDALYQHGITGLMGKHLAEIGHQVNVSLLDSMGRLSHIGTEAMVATLRELYGYTFIFGIGVLILLAASRFRRGVKKPIPTLRLLYTLAGRELKRRVKRRARLFLIGLLHVVGFERRGDFSLFLSRFLFFFICIIVPLHPQ